MPELFSQIAANRERCRLRSEANRVDDDEFAELVRAAFVAGHTGPEIAAVSGVSKERIYQIRDGRR